uniref:Xylulose kinase-1 n=1 Tax=Tanacetum cinerariifolium TaxID=118510 RepID=A0A6L2LPV7_TANCI|nr:hypothetical protein [Tanacetum cinerariifolium]
MVAILEKIEHNIDFHQIVDFLEASHIRYALTISPTVYVSHIRQFWSTARIKTTNQETKILAIVDGKSQTISESSFRRHLKLNDKEGISSLPDAKLFENLTARIETTNQETKILAIVDGKSQTISESSFRRHLKLNDKEGISSLPDAELFENLLLMGYNILPNQSNIANAVVCLATNRIYNFSKMIFDGEKYQQRYTRRAIQIAQPKALSSAADEHASLLRDDRQGEAFLTVSSLDARQDKENIAKTSALPHESSPRVTSLDANEGSMQQRIYKFVELCIILQRQQSQMAAKIKDQDLEIYELKARVKFLEDKERRSAEPTQEDALITRGIMETGEKLGADKSTELGSNDTEEMVNVLSSMEALNILISGGAPASVSPADVLPAAGPMRSPTIIGAKDIGKEKVVKSEVPKKRKFQEQIDAQVAREMEEEFARENQRVSEQLARDSEIARLYAKEELKMMIEGLDRNNESVSEDVSEEELKGMMHLVPLEEVYVEALQLWTHNQAFMHDPLDWKLYDTCGVHHVSTQDQEIFMLVEKDYPQRKGLATVIIILDEELIEVSSQGEHLILETGLEMQHQV